MAAEDTLDPPPMGPEADGSRQFTRLTAGPPTPGVWPLPPNGLCLSSFLLLSPAGRPGEILAGRIDPAAPWDRIGALDPDRIRNNTGGWMLPSCHLLYYEPPDDAARRILTEQLGITELSLGPPTVFSDTGPPRRHPHLGSHWDIGFLYRGTWPGGAAPTHPAWRELRFLDPARTPRSAFTRSHDEVLKLAGFRLAAADP